jgi:DNA-directed RNA polymerase specialized sigma24 family protein
MKKTTAKTIDTLSMKNGLCLTCLTLAYEMEKKFDHDTKNTAFLRLLEKKDIISVKKNYESLFYKACKNTLINNCIKDKNRQSHISYEFEMITENDLNFESSFLSDIADTSCHKYEVKKCLIDMFKLLKKGKESMIFSAFYLKGFNMPEISKKLKMSKVAVFKRLEKLEIKIGNSYQLNALRKAFIGIDSTYSPDNNGYGVNVQKTGVKQSYDIKPSECMIYSEFERVEFIPAKKRNDNNLKTYKKQNSGYCSGLNRFDKKDIGVYTVKHINIRNLKEFYVNSEHYFLHKNLVQNNQNDMATKFWLNLAKN